MVARPPVVGVVEGLDGDGCVEAARGERVVELVLGRCGGPAGRGERRHVQAVGWQPLRSGAGLSSALRVLGPEELHAQRVHPVGDGAITGGERQRVAVGGPVDHVQVAGGEDRCVAGSVLPMNAERSEMIRCAEPSA